MIRKLRTFGLLAAVLAFAALPAVSQADHGKHKGRGKGHSHCVIHVAYVVKGKLVSFTPDDPSTTGTNEVKLVLCNITTGAIDPPLSAYEYSTLR